MGGCTSWDAEVWPKVDTAVKVSGRQRTKAAISILWSDCCAAADIETEGAQINDVAHGGHAAKA